MNFTYLYQFPKLASETSWEGRVVDGWGVRGQAIFQSGQPYSVIDYTGAVGSIFYGTSNGITNPIVPLAPNCTPKSALTGASGAFEGAGGMPALKASCFTLPLLAAGGAANGVAGAIPSNDPYETNFVSNGQRNIFRQAWQKRADISIVKDTKINERVSVKYSFDVFNLTNTPSFDIPVDNVQQNLFFNDFPVQGMPATTSPCDPTGATALYVCTTTSGLGNVNKTIGSPRQIQMSLSVLF
jgi:hypothetical protein